MSTVNQKYIKDESGNKISPITSVDSIYDSQGGGISKYIVNLIYPIGSIYISVSSTSPATLFSGTTWSQLKDRFLLGVRRYI